MSSDEGYGSEEQGRGISIHDHFKFNCSGTNEPVCTDCGCYQIFNIAAQSPCRIGRSGCNTIKVFVLNKQVNWSHQASVLGKYVRWLFRVTVHDVPSKTSETSYAEYLEKVNGMCLFCDKPISAQNYWRCTCGIRDKVLMPVIQLCTPRELWKISTIYGRDYVTLESLLVLEALYCNRILWINFDGRIAVATITFKRVTLVICIRLSASAAHFRISRLAPCFLRGRSSYSEAYVMCQYSKTEFTWRPLECILMCYHNARNYCKSVKQRLAAPQQEAVQTSLAFKCQRSVLMNGLNPASNPSDNLKLLHFVNLLSSHAVFPVRELLNLAAENKFVKSLFQNVYYPNCVPEVEFREKATQVFSKPTCSI